MAPSGKAVSLWLDTAPETNYPQLREDLQVDTAVIGGGIAGLTTALLLTRAGQSVAVLEAGHIGSGVTGHTTGKVSSLHRLIYVELKRHFGEWGAATYAQANQAAIERVASLVEEENIECDFCRVDNYTFAESDHMLEKVREEAALAQQLQLPASFTTEVPLPFAVRGAVKFDNQAQLHSVKYLVGLAQAIERGGGYIFEGTRALDVEEGAPSSVRTDEGTLRAKNVVVATGAPFLDRGLFSIRSHPYRSYLVAGETEQELPEGTFISADDPLRSILPYKQSKEKLVLIGGEGHRAKSVDSEARYRHLAEYARERFGVESIAYRWSTQDEIPIDGMPFIGKLTPSSENVYVATGFRKWGLSNGTVAAMILSDTILNIENPWAKTFSSTRVKPLASARRFVVENAYVGLDVLKSVIQRISPFGGQRSIENIEPGEGIVVERAGEKVAISRDGDGVQAVSAICTHQGCVVEWNPADQTWDCPCHGSRFAPNGEVLHGPAVEALAKKR